MLFSAQRSLARPDPTSTTPAQNSSAILIFVKVMYFDGVCVLCNNFVKWLIAQDPNKQFKFSVIGSDRYQELLKKHPHIRQVDSVIYESEESVFVRGEAVKKIILDSSANSILKKLTQSAPIFLLNTYYVFVASARYRLFGRYDVCPPIPPEWRDRFLA